MNETYRFPGEFEPQQAVFACWVPPEEPVAGYDAESVCVEIVKNLIDEVQLFINCPPYVSVDHVSTLLVKNGVEVQKIKFLQIDDPNLYNRDNGANIMIDGKGHMVCINQGFNMYALRESTNLECIAARRAGLHQAIEVGCTDFINSNICSEGGNKEFNGRGVLIAVESTECASRNPHYSKEEIEAEYKRIFNLKKIIWLPSPLLSDENLYQGPLDVVHGKTIFGSSCAGHTDEMCRFIGVNKVLLAEITEEEASASRSLQVSKERLDAAYEILRESTDADGNAFDIVRMPFPEPIEYTLRPTDSLYYIFRNELANGVFSDGTPWPDGVELTFLAAGGYCNFLICNGVVVGQKYWREGMSEKVKEKDIRAERILKKCFPDRRIVMINTTALNLCGGGVHCWTKNVARADIR
ncbi:agmatine/peptidylarginine deiminase [Eggerthella sp. YY7918]|uniref:agmatine deiminase family protein n=1 Tax=Eggerthella sp. (strain YY7918) TaxID=502558 RepID=UPI00021710A7|nr:agmatine deiminase family protein [Eggerthella sp. YY7918]BAK43468.1 peptidylarginine deiminase [Eggerthella sp. YY7918]